MINRLLFDELPKLVTPGKVVIIYGPRRVGKTTILKEFQKTIVKPHRFENGEDIRFREVLESQSIETLKNYLQGYDLLIIDEAQRINNVGLGLKLLVDHLPHLKIIVTGSASFDLANKVGEPLTGRKVTRVLYPISQSEIGAGKPKQELKDQLEDFLTYGSYPELLSVSNRNDKIDYLREISGSYLFKDILELERVKSSKSLLDILRLLSFQIGNDISLTEIGSQVGLDYKTVARYLDLLEKAFVIKGLGGFSKNLRKEISKSKRYYFLDVGIRNAIISNFNEIGARNDVGQLWENFLLSERLKQNNYSRAYCNQFFWRTYQQEEVDLLEESDGKLNAFEFKYDSNNSKGKKPFLAAYPNSSFQVINKDNYLEWLAVPTS